MYEQAYRDGATFDAFLARTRVNRELWHAMAPRAKVPAAVVDRGRALAGNWRILAIADDWCGDAVNILPVVARLVEQVEGLDLRIVGREMFPELMDRHLTGGSRSIPVLILLDQDGVCRGWWGPRPTGLQAWFEAEGRPLPKEERYREIRRWYARDRGASIAREVVAVLACAASKDEDECDKARRTCTESTAA